MLLDRTVINKFGYQDYPSLYLYGVDAVPIEEMKCEVLFKYHTLIETCKNVGLNVKEYFTYVFRKLIEGEKDYEKRLPGTVAL